MTRKKSVSENSKMWLSTSGQPPGRAVMRVCGTDAMTQLPADFVQLRPGVQQPERVGHCLVAPVVSETLPGFDPRAVLRVQLQLAAMSPRGDRLPQKGRRMNAEPRREMLEPGVPRVSGHAGRYPHGVEGRRRACCHPRAPRGPRLSQREKTPSECRGSPASPPR